MYTWQPYFLSTTVIEKINLVIRTHVYAECNWCVAHSPTIKEYEAIYKKAVYNVIGRIFHKMKLVNEKMCICVSIYPCYKNLTTNMS